MQIIKLTERLSSEEKETHLNYDYIKKMWIMDSTVSKHFNKAIKQGWNPIRKYIYEDGTVAGMVLTAPDRAITIRNTEKKVLSEKQLGNLGGAD